jgi:AraC-like DNA-binding protein
MASLESAIRLMVIGQALLIAVVFLSGTGGRAARVSGAAVMIGAAAYLYMSGPLYGSLPAIEPFLMLVTLAVPFLVWSFARAIFDAPWPPALLNVAAGALLVGTWLMQVIDGWVDPATASGATVVLRTGGLIAMAHALWLAWWGRPDDLVERRRRFRLLFVAVIALQVTAILAVELVFGVGRVPAWLDMTNAIAIAALMLVLSIPMLRLRKVFFEPDRPFADAPAAEAGTAQDVYHRKLLGLMSDGYYRETGLTVPVLAERLDYPEHQLRRLINGHMGFRNFSAFLNSYRIGDAKRQLADPQYARTPVLTIALDLGYGSLGPFNRAFKAQTGMTPTEYRRRHLAAGHADSE